MKLYILSPQLPPWCVVEELYFTLNIKHRNEICSHSHPRVQIQYTFLDSNLLIWNFMEKVLGMPEASHNM
jgi:hypothetical protein